MHKLIKKLHVSFAKVGKKYLCRERANFSYLFNFEFMLESQKEL